MSAVYVMAHLRLGEFERAIGLARQYDERLTDKYNTVLTLKQFVEAQRDAAKRSLFLDKLAQNESVLSTRYLVQHYAGLGRIDDAYRVANKNPNSKRFGYLWVIWRTNMAPFRQDPRFAEHVTELGLLDYWRKNGWPDACQPAGDSVICK